MNLFWKEIPFLRLLLPLMIGIGIYLYMPSNAWLPPFILIAILCLGISLFQFLPDFSKLKFRYLKGIGIQASLMSLGYLLCVIHTISSSKQWYQHSLKDFDYALVQITEEPQNKPKTKKANVEIVQLISENKSISTKGEAIVYFQKSAQANSLKQGEIILVKNVFKDIKPNGNPGEFNYAQYLQHKNIFQSAYLKEGDWSSSQIVQSNLSSFFSQLGKSTRSLLRKYIPNNHSYGIAEALLIGYRNDIDHEIWQAYSDTGIVHIIAISGMHMAMIYMSIRWLLFLIPFMKRYRILSLSVAIVFMWLFAGITGLPPSVTRAAIMFTFIGVGEMLNREISGFNNLAVSAFCLLCINPFWLIDIGFQLSYLAVLSLLFFYNKIYHWFFIQSKILDAVWKLIAATLAAQILTFPLCVYYFHQFPLLFLLTNLIAVPATTIILYAEIILVSLSWISSLSKLLGMFISTAIQWLNEAVFMVSKLSFAVWSGIQTNLFETMIFFVMIYFVSIWFIQKKKVYLPYALLSVVILLSSFTINRIQSKSQLKMIVYHAQKQKALEFIKGETYYCPDDDSLMTNKSSDRFLLKPARLFHRLKRKDASIVQIQKSEEIELFQFGKKTIARIHQTNFSTKQKLDIDYLILSDQSKPDFDWIKSNFNVNQIIIDSSIPSWKAMKIKHSLVQQNFMVHDINDDGAFVLDL